MSSSDATIGRKSSAQVLIAVFPPFFFVLSTALLIPVVFRIPVSIAPVYFIMLFLLAMFQTAVADVFFRSYSRMTFVEPLIPIIIGAVAVMLFRNGSVPERFIPGWDILLPMAGVFTQVMITSVLYHYLRECAVSIADHERLANTALREETRRNVDLYLGIRDLKRIKIALVLMTILLLIALFIAVGMRARLTGVHHLFLGLYSLSLLISFGSVNISLENLLRRTENIILPDEITRRRFPSAVIIVCICLAGAFVFSGDHALLPLNFISDLLSQINIQMPTFDMHLPDVHQNEILPPENVIHGSPSTVDLTWLSITVKVIVFILLGTAALLVLIMVIGSLFSPAIASVSVRGNPFMLFFSRFLLLARAIADLIRSIFGPRKRSYDKAGDTAAFNEKMLFSGIVDKRASAAKQRETNRVIAAFVKVIRWGKGHEVPFMKNLAPQEYLTRIERRYPLLAPSLTIIGTTFEEAIFSLNLVGESRIAAYFQAAKNVLRYREKK